MDALNNLQNIISTVPIRNGFSSSDQLLLDAVKGIPMDYLMICKTPLDAFIGQALSIATKGKWKQAVADAGFDDVFHLFLVVSFKGRGERYTLEKNETIRFRKYDGGITNKSEKMKVNLNRQGTDIDTFLNKTKTLMGADFWKYSAFGGLNCQNFVENCLKANGYLTPKLREFIVQDVDGILKALPAYTQEFADATTGLAGRFRSLTDT